MIRCWWRGHDHFTMKVDGGIVKAWGGSPDYVFERDGLLVIAPPCLRCGSRNPEAHH